MDNFDAHKWFKKEYLGEGHTNDEDKVVAKGDGIEITQKQMERLQKGYPVRLSNGSVLASPFVKEGHTEDKTERDQAIRRYDQLSDDDKLKLAKIQKMMDKERSLKEDDLNEISRDAYDRMEGLANQRDLNELKDLIMILGGEWANEGFENEDIVDYFEDLVYKLVRS